MNPRLAFTLTLINLAAMTITILFAAKAGAHALDSPDSPENLPVHTTHLALSRPPDTPGWRTDRITVPTTARPPAPVEHAHSPPPAPSGRTRTVVSTSYCLTGTMANGELVHDGAVAMNGVPFGARWRVLTGPMSGRVFTVKDRIGWGSQFDIWQPSCDAARRYGRRAITIERAS